MSLDLDLLHWVLAAVPIVALIILMVGKNWTAQQAGTTSIFIAAAVAVFAFETSTRALSVASAKGIWDAIPILFVVWPALLLFHIMNQSGGYDALRRGITRMSRNELFIVVALGWVFTSFLQGIDGFGTPIAVVAPLLVAFGMRPVYAVAIPIIAHIWAKFYGTLGVGWLATLQVVDIDAATALSMGLQSAVLILIQVLLGGLTVVWLYGRWAAVRQAWPLIMIIGAIQGIGQIITVFIDPILAAFLPATAALIALYPLSRWSRYNKPIENIPHRPAMREDASMQDQGVEPPMSPLIALAPYGLLTFLAVSTSLIDPLHAWLDQASIGFAFPEIVTGMGVMTAASAQYSALHIFTHPGATITLTALITWAYFAHKGYFSTWKQRTPKEQPGVIVGMFSSAVPASVPILAFLIMASIMKHSGQNAMLALGIAEVAPSYVFAFVANGIGILGAFITSSSTSSQVLFSELQLALAKAKGLPEATILAAQNAGGAIGNAIAPANVVMGASTTGINGKEGAILRKTIPWTLLVFVLTGIATVIMSMIMA